MKKDAFRRPFRLSINPIGEKLGGEEGSGQNQGSAGTVRVPPGKIEFISLSRVDSEEFYAQMAVFKIQSCSAKFLSLAK